MKKHSRNKHKRNRTRKNELIHRESNSSKTRVVNTSMELESDGAILDGYDEQSLAQMKTYWFFGEWQKLADFDDNLISTHPERDRFYLLKASAFQQLGDHDKARVYARTALNYGCSSKVVAQVLIAGVHNALGRAASLLENESRISQHFKASISAIGTEDSELMGHARSVREMARMGLLPQAMTLLGDLSSKYKCSKKVKSLTDAHLKVLDMEVNFLREKIMIDSVECRVKSIHLQQTNNTPPIKGTSKQISIENKKYFGHNYLDKKLEVYLDYDEGFFVELGANDGINQSNTYYFEKERNWKGILIEPILHNYLKCKKNRVSGKNVYCAACVSFGYKKEYVRLIFSNLMTSPLDLNSDIEDPAAHANSGVKYLTKDEDIVEVMAPAKTLNFILNNSQAPNVIDLLSLDVEGAEIEVLKGIDYQKYEFKYMLIESRAVEKIDSYLNSKGYHLLNKLSHHDYLFYRA